MRPSKPQSKSQQDELPDLNNLKEEIKNALFPLMKGRKNTTANHRMFDKATQTILDHVTDYLNRVVPEKRTNMTAVRKRLDPYNYAHKEGWNAAIDEIHKRLEGEL
jgi:hypothetical protein